MTTDRTHLGALASTTRQETRQELASYSTRQLLDRHRQTSTDLDAQAHGVRLDRLDRNSTVTRQARQARPRQRLDSASTAPRQCLDGASTARQLDSQGSSFRALALFSGEEVWNYTIPACMRPLKESPRIAGPPHMRRYGQGAGTRPAHGARPRSTMYKYENFSRDLGPRRTRGI